MFKFITLSIVASAVALAPASAQGTNQPAKSGQITEAGYRSVSQALDGVRSRL